MIEPLPIKLHKTFVLEDENTSKTQVLQYEVNLFQNKIDLHPLISHTIQNIKGIQIKIYDFTLNKYTDIECAGTQFKIPLKFFGNQNSVVLIKYCQYQSETMSISSYASSAFNDAISEATSKKTQRSKQRIILQVIQIVKKWRKLCESKKGQNMTLAQAADGIGLPKKSLDDYYYQLRMGQKYGFDYHAHIFERIGTLRSFLKKYRTHRTGDKNEKLPNVLKIADEIDDYQSLIRQNQDYSQKKFSTNKIIEQQIQQSQQQPLKQQRIQVQFYNQFNYNFEGQGDPFLSIGKGQQRMNEDFSSNMELFF